MKFVFVFLLGSYFSSAQDLPRFKSGVTEYRPRLMDTPIKILRLYPRHSTRLTSNFYLEIRIEPNQLNRYLTVRIENLDGQVSASERSLIGANEPSLTHPYTLRDLPAGAYSVEIATWTADPALSRKAEVVYRVKEPFYIGVTPSSVNPFSAESGDPGEITDITHRIEQPRRRPPL